MFTNDIIVRALEEDLGEGDITTEMVIPEEFKGFGSIVAKESLVAAGLGVAGGVFLTHDPRIKLNQMVSDGRKVEAGEVLLTAEGSYRSLLQAERVALNFLQRLCGIATATRKFVDRVGPSPTQILDTRKTVPIIRHLDKYAVRMGGGHNHRFGLYDAILIKANHVAACGGSFEEAVRRVCAGHPGRPVEVEVARVDDVGPAIASGASHLLLDNMSDADVAASMKTARKKVKIEVSGGISLERVEGLARLGVDFISVGALTHSVRASDIHFRIEPR